MSIWSSFPLPFKITSRLQWLFFTQKHCTKKNLPWWCGHSPRARHPGVWSQVGLRKQYLSATLSIVSLSICHEVMGLDAMIFVFWMLSFKTAFSLSSFIFIKRLFSSSLLSALRVVSPAYANKDSRGDRSPAELFKILKDGAVKVLHSIFQQTWKTQQWPQDWKGQFLFQTQRRAVPKNVQTTRQLHSFYMLGRLCSKTFKWVWKWVFNSTWTENFHTLKLDLEKAEVPKIKI